MQTSLGKNAVRIYYFLSFPPQIAIAIGFVLFRMPPHEGGGIIMAVLNIIAEVLFMSIIRKRRAAAGDLEGITS